MSQKVVAVKSLSWNRRNLRNVVGSYYNRNKEITSQKVPTLIQSEIYHGMKSISSWVVWNIGYCRMHIDYNKNKIYKSRKLQNCNWKTRIWRAATLSMIIFFAKKFFDWVYIRKTEILILLEVKWSIVLIQVTNMRKHRWSHELPFSIIIAISYLACLVTQIQQSALSRSFYVSSLIMNEQYVVLRLFTRSFFIRIEFSTIYKIETGDLFNQLINCCRCIKRAWRCGWILILLIDIRT